MWDLALLFIIVGGVWALIARAACSSSTHPGVKVERRD